MRFAHLLSRITGSPWLITDDALANIAALMESRIAPVDYAEKAEGYAKAFRLVQHPTPMGAIVAIPEGAKTTGTVVIPIQGVIGKRLSSMEMMCGGADIELVEAAFDAANNDASISRIVLHVDSPGGTVTGVPELAQKIYDTKRKPVMAVSDTLIASAAYYLASAADEIVVTPTTNVGSIGVVLQVRETTSTASADGRTRLKVFRSGADKMVGADAPLTEGQAAMLQERVDFLGAMFRGDVTKARPNVSADSMTGNVYFGDEAVKRHLADRVVANLAAALG